jgi:glutamyl-tRNA reductase
LLVGAGKMSTLAAKHLRGQGVSEIRVANRSLERATQLAKEIDGKASSLEDLELLLQQADIVITSTAATSYIVDKKLMARVMRNRRYRSILFIVLAVPRDVDPAVAELDNVFVYDVDDLQNVLDENRSARAKEAEAADKIIDEEVRAFVRKSKSEQVVPVIKALRDRVTEIASGEADRTVAGLKDRDPRLEHSVRAMSQAIVNKLLHPVMTRLKREGAEGDPTPYVDALEALFELEIVQEVREELEAALAPAEAPADNVVPMSSRDRGGRGGQS